MQLVLCAPRAGCPLVTYVNAYLSRLFDEDPFQLFPLDPPKGACTADVDDFFPRELCIICIQ